MWGTHITNVVGKWVKPSTVKDSYRIGINAFEAGDYETAFLNWEISAKQGFAAAQHSLGAMYEHGHGAPQDYQKAIYWYGKAAESGHSIALHNLGVLYANGQGVRRDYRVAKDLWFASAQQRFLAAQVKLGTLYRHGYGIPKDYAMAYAWYQLAAVQGDEQGKINRHTLAEQMKPKEIELAQRIFREFYEKYVVRCQPSN
jgi:TPR repeat protein